MGDFFKGVSSIGQLSPPPASYADYPPPQSAWQSVANSFRQTGDNIRRAIKECSDAKPEKKQTP